jgi:hypothetical protein
MSSTPFCASLSTSPIALSGTTDSKNDAQPGVMGSARAPAADLVSKYGTAYAVHNEATLAECESALSLPQGLLHKIQRATDPEQGRGDLPTDFGMFNGKKSLKLWCLTEAYGYDIEEYGYDLNSPNDCLEFITARYAKCNRKPTVTPDQAAIIYAFFVDLYKIGDAELKSTHEDSIHNVTKNSG